MGIGLALAVAPRIVSAEKDGIDSTLYFEGAVGCGSPALGETEGCHANPESDMVDVAIDGPPAIELESGVGFYTVTAMTTLQDQDGAGVNVLIDAVSSTSDCELDPFPTQENNQLVVEGPVLTHRDAENPPPLGSLGVFSYSFLLINCSTPGSIRMLAAMNTFNGDGESTGDAWNQAEKTVTVPESGGAAVVALFAFATLARGRSATQDRPKKGSWLG
jgi:hypothetical protein